MSGTNGHGVTPPLPPDVTITRKPSEPKRKALRIVNYVRKSGFEEKAALLEYDLKRAKLRIFDGLTTTTIVTDVPFSPTKRRGHWTWQGGKP
jgi:hypothetical protein